MNPPKRTAIPLSKSKPPTNLSRAVWYGVAALVGASLGCITLLTSWLFFAPTGDSIANAGPRPVLKPPFVVKDADMILGKLTKISEAFWKFEDAYKQFTPSGEAKLSWRVYLLPYLDEMDLFSLFRLNEPWDSKHNKALLEKMPEIYRIGSADKTTSRIQVLSGPDMLFGSSKRARAGELTDGFKQTVLALVAGDDKGIAWTKPDELILDKDFPVASLGNLPEGFIFAVPFEGSPLILPTNIDPLDFVAMCTPRGGEVVDVGSYRRKIEDLQMGGSLATQLAVAASTSTAPKSPFSKPSTSVPDKVNVQQVVKKKRIQKLLEIRDGIDGYTASFQQLPIVSFPNFFRPDGKPYLSWRVHILRFMDEPLFSQFKLNEPWDSPSNLPLLSKIPEVYRDPLLEDENSGKTCIVTLTGTGTSFPAGKGLKLNEMTDGLETIVIVSVSPEKAVPWTKPDDLVFDSGAPIECLGNLDIGCIVCSTVNGRVYSFKPTVPPDLFKAMVSPNGGESIPPDLAEFLAY